MYKVSKSKNNYISSGLLTKGNMSLCLPIYLPIQIIYQEPITCESLQKGIEDIKINMSWSLPLKRY